MKPAYFTIALLLSVLFSCQGPAKEHDEQELSGFDTIPGEPLERRELMPAGADSARYMNILQELVKEKLYAHPGQTTFDTSALINGYTATIRFVQGNLFSKNKHHAIAQVSDANEQPFFYFEYYEDKWVFKQLIHTYGMIPDSSLSIRDYNFDGYNDLAVRWYYKAGRCNCDSPGCLNLYLYDPVSGSLNKYAEISEYLDVQFINEQKVVYLGEVCGGKWGKFKWKGNNLVKLEEYIITPRDGFQRNDSTCIMTYNKYDGEKIIFSKSERTCYLPAKWIKIFNE
jgi:hypothetical protein